MEKRNSVAQRMEVVERFFSEHAERLAQQGSIVATFRQRGGRRVGPYYRLVCRGSDRRQVSVYLGAEGLVVAETRRRLEHLQEHRKQQRFWALVRRDVHKKMKAARRRLAEELAKQELTTQGAEIRGWRQLG